MSGDAHPRAQGRSGLPTGAQPDHRVSSENAPKPPVVRARIGETVRRNITLTFLRPTALTSSFPSFQTPRSFTVPARCFATSAAAVSTLCPSHTISSAQCLLDLLAMSGNYACSRIAHTPSTAHSDGGGDAGPRHSKQRHARAPHDCFKFRAQHVTLQRGKGSGVCALSVLVLTLFVHLGVVYQRTDAML